MPPQLTPDQAKSDKYLSQFEEICWAKDKELTVLVTTLTRRRPNGIAVTTPVVLVSGPGVSFEITAAHDVAEAKQHLRDQLNTIYQYKEVAAPAPTAAPQYGATMLAEAGAGGVVLVSVPEPLAPAANNPAYATAQQKEQIIRLLNHTAVTRQEKTKTLLNLNKLSEVKAAAKIDELQGLIDAAA